MVTGPTIPVQKNRHFLHWYLCRLRATITLNQQGMVQVFTTEVIIETLTDFLAQKNFENGLRYDN